MQLLDGLNNAWLIDNKTNALQRARTLFMTFFVFLRFVQLILGTFVMQLGKKPQKDCWYVKIKIHSQDLYFSVQKV